MISTGYAGCHDHGIVWDFPEMYNNSEFDSQVKSYAHLKFYQPFDFHHTKAIATAC